MSAKRVYAQIVFYPTLWWNVLLGRVLKVRNWWDRIDDGLYVGAMPFESDVDDLVQAGVRAVVNTCEEYAGPIRGYERTGIRQHRMPTVDFTHPSLEDVEQAVDFIHTAMKSGDGVYVHCKAGRARSATVALCWLIRHRGLDPQQGQQHLLKQRPHVNSRLAERPVVVEFFRRHQQSNRQE